MAGLLSKRSIGGLLGSGMQEPGFADYALALLAGGVGGAAGLALNSRMAGRERARMQPFADDLNAAFDPQTTFAAGQTAPGGLQLAPRAEERNGVLQRQLQAGPGLQGAPTSQTNAANPTMAQLAPLLLRARAAGLDTSPYETLLKGMSDERKDRRPSLYNTRRGIVGVDPDDQTTSMVYEVPEEPDAPPSGYDRLPDGSIKINPGYLEGQRQLTAGRRDEVVSRPMPGRPRASGGGAAGGGAPWKNRWTP